MTIPAPRSEPSDSAAAGVVAAITAVNRGGAAELVARKYAVMRQSPFAFMRGTCHLFFDTLPVVPLLRTAPAAWLCGDMHVENFGTYKGDNRLTYFDVSDFDESALGPVALDLVRFLASIHVGADEWGVSADDAQAAAHRALVAYVTELALGKPSWIERENARGAVKRLFAQVAGRSRTELLDSVSTRKARRRRFVLDGTHLLPASESECAAVEAMLQQLATAARDPDYFRVVDVARRVAGIGSITVPRFAVLIEGRGSPDRNALLDLKCAHPSSLLPVDAIPQPHWGTEAERVVAVQRHAVVVAPAFLAAVHDESDPPRSFCARELQLGVDRVRLRDWERQPKKLGEAIVVMGAVAAWMHLRAAAWRGSATVEALSAFAHDVSWRDEIAAIAREAAERTLQQYGEFARAYDAGEMAGAL